MYFQNKSKWRWIWSGGWECWAVSGVIGRWSWFYLHIYAAKYVYFWILQRRLARHWGADVIHAGSRRGYLKKNSRIELCMVDKRFGGRQYQKTTLASNPKRDYTTDMFLLSLSQPHLHLWLITGYVPFIVITTPSSFVTYHWLCSFNRNHNPILMRFSCLRHRKS